MSEQQTRKIDAWIGVDGQLVASEQKANERKNKIGTSKLPEKRRATADDMFNLDGSDNKEGTDAYLKDGFVEKEGLDDQALQTVVAARLDEKLLDIAESGERSTEAIKAYDSLSRIKSLIQFLNFGGDVSLQESVFNAREDFKEKGDTDMAEIADAASNLIHELSLEALDLQGDSDGDNAHAETTRVVREHNQRVVANSERLKAA